MAAFLATGLLYLTTGELPAAERAPEPASGQFAATTLALLHHNHDLCDRIAGQVLERWADLDGGQSGEQRMRDYVLERALSDLAAARAAGDLVRRFLPGARSEVGLETGSSLERLAELQTQLCNLVALPAAPRDAYEASVADLSNRIAREESELGRLLVVPEAELQRALTPYLVPIQLAGVEAEGEYLDYLESLREVPEPPTLAELMIAWHRSIYGPGVQPVKQALGSFLQARQSGDNRLLSASCREMSREVVGVLDHPRILESPDPAVNAALRRAYVYIQRLAARCTAGDFQGVDSSFTRMQHELQVSASVLAKYSLRP